MYNRYIPQPDGSFRRNRVDEPRQRPAPPQKHREPPRPEPECKPEPEQIPCPPPHREPEHTQHREPRQEKHESVTGFLQNLLPKDLDTGDLIVILLLLLLAGDCEEDRSNALLTLALYLFM